MKNTSRTHKAKKNIATSLFLQVITFICGIIVPRLMIKTFGSELYGTTTSISHFLAYITLVEGGVAGVARAALYKPLASGNMERISAVISEIKRFFRIVAAIFLAYTLVIAVFYKGIAKTDVIDWFSTFCLVLIISMGTMAQYYFGITNTILLNADQRTYVTNIVSTITIVVNTLVIILAIKLGFNILFVKLASSVVFVVKPIVFYLYVRRKYKIINVPQSSTPALRQKWSALGQHIAYFLHSNTDVVILTIFVDLKSCAVYSVYNMIISSIRKVVSSFSGGMESVFGNMYANEETDHLKDVFSYYDTLISVMATIFFSTTGVLIIPFVKLYTANIEDANYIVPMFALFIVLAEYVYCLRMPYHQLTMATNSFVQTRMAAYGEAVINIVLSIGLVFRFELAGVALATFIAVSFRMIFYAVYLSKNIIHRGLGNFIKRELVNFGSFGLITVLAGFVINHLEIGNYYIWVTVGFVQFFAATLVVIGINSIFYGGDVKAIIGKFSNKLISKKRG